MTLALVPFPADPVTAVTLLEDALRARLAPGEDLRDLLPPLASAVQGARALGGLLREDGEVHGIALWEPAGPVGVWLRLLYLTPAHATVDRYRDALDLVERTAGPLAFAPGPLAGLTEEEESSLLRGRGFAPYGRSEMAFPPTAPVPPLALPPGTEVRSARLEDEPILARLHEHAYRDHLDRYLGIEDLDPSRDADRQVRACFSGRYGELLIPGSTVVSLDGAVAAAVVAVRVPPRALLVDVMAEPDLHGRGLGRAAVIASLRDLRARGENSIFLNVTEGNRRALRLYSGLGFVRTLGPSKEWYDARRLKVEPR